MEKKFYSKRATLKFLVIFSACLLLFYAFYYSNYFQDYLKAPILTGQTLISGYILNLFGYGVAVNGDELSSMGILIKVSGGCDGLEATALFLIVLLLFPTPFKYKKSGMLIGAGVLTLLNIFRIIGLFLIAKYWESAFEFMHTQGGLYLYVFVTIFLVILWSDWALKSHKEHIRQISN